MDFDEDFAETTDGGTENLTEKVKQKAGAYNMWSKKGPCFTPSEGAVECLEPGLYGVTPTVDQVMLVKKEVQTDDLMVWQDSPTSQVLADIEKFWTREQAFRRLGCLWKRGIMLHGPPGSGKTSILNLVTKTIVDRGGVGLMCQHPGLCALGLDMLRGIEKERPVVVLLEDLDAIAQHYESNLLALLDGELQVDNVVFLATTNYPQKLDPRIVNRPSRFDLILEVGMPAARIRRQYFEERMAELFQDPAKVKKWVDATDGFSIAHLKELVIAVEVFDLPFDRAVQRMRDMISGKVLERSGSARGQYS